ncbi:MAG: adenylyl-sulfate kinase [Candidatus Rokubacteria bacterium]|nr:adenylyl-sulfate kinase [Candidatus Rokubacteria bacterium]
MSWAIWITGLPGSGKSVLARALASRLRDLGTPTRVLEMDALRKILAPSLAYGHAERDVAYRALVYLATTLTESGVPVIVDATGHRRAWRDLARVSIPNSAEVQLVCPLEVCRERERARVEGNAPRGIYAAAGRPGSTVPGVDVPYEPALSPEAVVDTAREDVPTAVERIVPLALELARAAGVLPRADDGRWAIWITGLPGSGKTTLASSVAERLAARGVRVRLLESGEARRRIVPHAHPAPWEEDLVHRALACAAKLLTESGVPVIIDAAAPRRAWRRLARELVPRFAEVQLVCPPEICGHRESLVRWNPTPCAHAGRPKAALTEPPELLLDYERSLTPELTIHTDVQGPWGAVEEILRLVERLRRAATTSTTRSP